jgi:hypothetical protein
MCGNPHMGKAAVRTSAQGALAMPLDANYEIKQYQ